MTKFHIVTKFHIALLSQSSVRGHDRSRYRSRAGWGGVRMRGAIGVALQGDGRHCDDRISGKPLFQIVVFWLAFSQSLSPAIIIDDDRNVIGVFEGHRRTIERNDLNAARISANL